MRSKFLPASPLGRDEYSRQSRVISSAVRMLPNTDAAREFLNSHHPAVGGRPLDLATRSDAGLLAVETALLWNTLNPSRNELSARRSFPDRKVTDVRNNSGGFRHN